MLTRDVAPRSVRTISSARPRRPSAHGRRRHPSLLGLLLVLGTLGAQGADWADLPFERAPLLDFDFDEQVSPVQWRDASRFRRRSRSRRPRRDPDRIPPGPMIPEPMVFDLVRPLNALAGEFEANVLAIFPMKRGPGGITGLPDPIGTVPARGGPAGIEWAPEFEWCPRDGVTWEAEFPFIDDRFEAVKIAHQRMLGTGFDDHLIYGWQGIGLNDFDSGTTTLALLAVAGWRFDRTWSTLALIGGRQEIGPRGFRGTEYLQNVSLFADLSEDFILGIETNYQQDFSGPAALLLMPQFHWQLTRVLNFQAGAGYRFADKGNMPEAAIRVILAN
jgi:hypothetical protein